MKQYKCEFPYCDFETDDRQQIEYHHIIPRSLNGSNKSNNRIWLCRNCHSKIYIPNTTRGLHSKNRPNKIMIIGWKTSTNGKKILHYKTYDEKEEFYELTN